MKKQFYFLILSLCVLLLALPNVPEKIKLLAENFWANVSLKLAILPAPSSVQVSLPSSPIEGGGPITPMTSIVFSGRASPESRIILFEGGRIVNTIIVSDDANFSMALSGLSAGEHLFGIYGEDSGGNRTSSLTLPVNVTPGSITEVDNILIAPIIAISVPLPEQAKIITETEPKELEKEISAKVVEEKKVPELLPELVLWQRKSFIVSALLAIVTVIIWIFLKIFR